MRIFYLLPVILLGCAEPPVPKTSPPSLPVVTIATADVATVQLYPAAIEGSDNIEIRPQVTGILEKVYVDDGAFVKAGQPLFRIEQAPFLQRLNNAKASLHVAEGSLSAADLEIDKLSPLVKEKVIADYQLRTAQSAREVALGNAEQAKAVIASAAIDVGYTLIKAPLTGYVGRLLRKKGSVVGPADPIPLTELSAVQTVHVFFALGEFDFIRFKDQYAGKTIEEKIKQLPPVELMLANDSMYAVKGKIDLIDGQFNKNTGAITVRASFPNPSGLLRSGNTGKVKMLLKFAGQAIVPQAATQEMQDKVFVFLVNDSNKVSKQLIDVFGKSGTSYLVKAGLKAGDRIVYSGYDHLHEGDIISPHSVDVQNIVVNH